jgi:threonine/homoserine/homoserine lactone efflux protein
MDLGLFVRGVVLGFSIAAPVGPIGVLCIRRTLAQGRVIGFASGLGAATADMFYGAVAALGLTVVSNLLVSQQSWLRLIGGLFLLYLGIKTFRTPPASEAAETKTGAKYAGVFGAYLSTLLLTLTNPATILSFTLIFSSVGLSLVTDSSLAILLVIGVFCGSALWWLLLSGGVSLARNRINGPVLARINQFAGVVIVIFGIVALGSLLR